MPAVTSELAVFASLGDAAGKLDADTKRIAYEAAEAYVADRCTWAVDGSTSPAPASLVEAVILLTARYLERRNTPSGVLGSGDFGVVRISGADRDAERLMAPWLTQVLA